MDSLRLPATGTFSNMSWKRHSRAGPIGLKPTASQRRCLGAVLISIQTSTRSSEIEAGRLRRALDHYYLTVGGSDGLRIAIPKGTYVPAFGPANSNQLPTATLLSASTTPLSSQNRGLAIFVMPFEEEGDQSAFPNFTRGFTRLLIVGLMRFTGLTVFGSGPILACGNVNKTEKLATDVDVDFILSGGTTISATRFNVEALLTEAWNGRCVWAESFEQTLAPAQIVSTRDEVAALHRAVPRPALRRRGQQSAAGNDSSQPASLNVCQ